MPAPDPCRAHTYPISSTIKQESIKLENLVLTFKLDVEFNLWGFMLFIFKRIIKHCSARHSQQDLVLANFAQETWKTMPVPAQDPCYAHTYSTYSQAKEHEP